MGDRAGHGDAAVGVEHHQGGVQVVGADVVEVDVDAVGRGLAQLFQDRARPVVEGGVAADLAQPADLVLAARAADHPGGALDLGDLAGHAAHRAGRAGDEHHVALFQLGDVEQAHVGGQRGHAEHAQVGGRGQPSCGGHLPRLPGGQDGLVPPAQHVQDQVAFGQVRRAGLDDRADRAALQRLAQPERRDVGLHVVHPAAHVRVDRHEQVAHPDLPVGELGPVRLGQREVRRGRPSGRPRGEDDLAWHYLLPSAGQLTWDAMRSYRTAQ